MLEDADKQPMEGKQGAGKPKGKKLAQATEGAEAPPEENRPDSESTQAPTDMNPLNHTMTQPLQNPSQVPARLLPRTPPRPPLTNPPSPPPQTPTKMNHQLPPSMLKHTKQQARIWLESVVKDGEAAYTRLFNKLLVLGDPYIDNFDQMQTRNKYSSVSGTKQAGSWTMTIS